MPEATLPRLVVVVGPTASGKTGLAIEIARQTGGEVVSADSRQVYRGLDIGTEKVTRREMRGVPHHCIDIASPRRALSVEQWRRHAERAIASIVRRGHVPIVTGGTGFYVDALVFGAILPPVHPNAALRRSLAAKSASELLAQLRSLDPARAETVEQSNPRRLIRAIEIATALGHVPPLTISVPRYDVTWIGLLPDMKVLVERLENRLNQALRRGLVAETKHLRSDLGLSWKRINELGLEYRLAGAYLRGEVTKQEMHTLMLRELRRYAKRQITWFKHNKSITWYPSATSALSKKKLSFFFTNYASTSTPKLPNSRKRN